MYGALKSREGRRGKRRAERVQCGEDLGVAIRNVERIRRGGPCRGRAAGVKRDRSVACRPAVSFYANRHRSRRVSQQIVNHARGWGIVENAETAAEHGLAILAGRPAKTDAR